MVSPLVPRGQEAERPVAQSPDSGARRHEFSTALTLPSFGASGKSCDLPVLPHLSGATKAPSWGVVRLNQLLFVDRPKQCLIQNSHLTHGLGNMRFLIREFSKELMLALPLKHSNRIFLGYASLTVQAASPPPHSREPSLHASGNTTVGGRGSACTGLGLPQTASLQRPRGPSHTLQPGHRLGQARWQPCGKSKCATQAQGLWLHQAHCGITTRRHSWGCRKVGGPGCDCRGDG